MLVWQGSFDKMNVEEFKKLSMDDKIDWVYRTTGADVNTNSDSVGLATRMDELDTRLAILQELAVVAEADGNIKEEEVTVNGNLPAGYMPGTQRMFDSFTRRNQAMILWHVSIS